jgi:hypothetical protein
VLLVAGGCGSDPGTGFSGSEEGGREARKKKRVLMG